MDRIASSLGSLYPDTNEGHSVTIDSLHNAMVGDIARLLMVLLGAVALVLLIACVNVANLLLARGSVREREVAIRLSLGAGRLRLMRQFLTGSLVLGVIAGGAGLGLAVWGLEAIKAKAPEGLPQLKDASRQTQEQCGVDKGRVEMLAP